ncbi:hypothetical protein ACPXCS_06155 [Streptomyces sp. DT190]|uniref:hypothetical protein n=1 Tax=unclassified Streptomyces TaxID=2593676 RepID=UPI003CEAF554
MANYPDHTAAAQKLLDQQAQINQLTAEIARLRTGEEDGYDPLVRPTPGQWLRKFNNSPIPERLAVVERIIDACTRASTCFEMNHEARLRQLQDDYDNAARWRNEQADRADRMQHDRDVAYRERAHLLALLATMVDHAVIAPAPDVDEPGWWLLYLTLGGRQASWHISPQDATLFRHVEHVTAGDARAQWDGHSTEDKYAGIAAWTAELAQRCGPACSEMHTETGRCEIARNR